jgi:hypothetical protein
MIEKDNLRIKPIIRQQATHVVKLEYVLATRPKIWSKDKRAFPAIEIGTGPLNFAELTANILLVLHVRAERPHGLLLEIDPAEPEISAFISKEARTLLHSIRISHAEPAGHICDSKPFHSESTIHRLAADKYPAILSAPINDNRLPFTPIYLEDLRPIERSAKRPSNIVKFR